MIYISFRFDDGHSSQYEIASKMLKKFNMVGSFYIITDLLDTDGRITEKQLKKLYKYGNEIGSHTQSHCTQWLSKSNRSQINEIVGSKNKLRSLGVKPTIFCFPKMRTSVFTEDIVKKYYKAFFKGYSTRRTLYTMNNEITSTPTKFGINLILDEIKRRSNMDEWLVITFHEISPTPSIYGVTIQDLYKIIHSVYQGVLSGTHKNVTVYEGYKLFSKQKYKN